MSRLSELERRIGRNLLPSEHGSVASLNDMPEAVIDEARQLQSPGLAHIWLAHFAEPDSHRHLKGFIYDVVEGGQAASQWQRGGVLIPAPSLAEQLTSPRQALLAPIGGFHGVRIAPALASWQARMFSVGSPARPWPERDYRSEIPEDSSLLSTARIELAEDEGVTVRRWIAARLSGALKPAVFVSVEALLALMPSLPAWEYWSPDARAAAAVLIEENRRLGPAQDQVPGFRAPDEWVRAADLAALDPGKRPAGDRSGDSQ